MKISALEMKFLESARDTRNDELIQLHRDVHELVCDHQDDACTVPEDIALQVLAKLQQFSLVRFHENAEVPDYFAVSLVERDSNGCDVLWCAIAVQPNKSGRYEATSASDVSKHFFRS